MKLTAAGVKLLIQLGKLTIDVKLMITSPGQPTIVDHHKVEIFVKKQTRKHKHGMFAYLFFLLKGVRWLWIATLVLVVLGFVNSLVTGPRTWYGIGVGVISLGLLLLPATRRYFAGEPVAERSPQTSPP